MDPSAKLFVRYRERGDLRALGAVFDELAPRLLPVALHLCGHPADAEDALQQTFVLAIERADTFDATRRLEPWLAGLLTNVARNLRRDGQRRRAAALPEVAADDEGPADRAERAELVAQLRTHLDALPDEQRQALLLQLQHGLSPAEIAEALAVPAGTVRMRIHRGLQALRRLLPAGLAALAFAGTPTRGLAAVRAAVLHAGAARTAAIAAIATTATTPLLGGYLAMKKLLAALAVLLVCGIAWQALAAPPDLAPLPAAAPEHAAPVAAASPVGRDDELAQRTGAPAAGRTATTGALRIRALAAVEADTDLPLPGMFVVVWRGAGALEPFDSGAVRMVTDDRGEVVLPALPPGTWNARLPAWRDEARAIEVAAGATAELEFRQPARTVLRGLVVGPSGQPVPGADLWLQRGTYMAQYSQPEPGEIECRCAGRSGPDGRFAIAVVDVREARISASCAGFGESRGRYVHNTRAELRLVLLAGEARLSGTVRDSEGAPVADALVQVMVGGDDSRRAGDGTLLAGRAPRLTRTDRDGCFRFVGLAAGPAEVGASAYPRNPTRRELELVAGAVAAVDLVVPDGVTVIGSVRFADGTSARARVTSRPEHATDGHYSECDVRPDGTFLLRYQPRRAFDVVAAVGGIDVAVRTIDEPRSGVARCDLVLDAATPFVRGRVIDCDGAPLAGWSVVARTPDGRQAAVRTAVDGAFCVPLPSAVAAAISAIGPEAKAAAVTRDGVHADTEIELRVPAGAVQHCVVRGRILAATGAPARCEVRLASTDGRVRRDAATATDGTFAVRDLQAGEWTLTYLHGGNRTALVAPFALASGEERDLGDLALPALATLVPEFTDRDGRPWTAEPPAIRLHDAAGSEAEVDYSLASGRMSVRAAPGAYVVTISATDLLAEPQPVTLTANTETTVRIALAIGRSRTVTFNGDGSAKPAAKTPLHVTIRRADGTVELQQDVADLYPDLRGFRYWYVTHVFAFGRYDVEAATDGGWRYRGTIEVGEDLDAPTQLDVPRAQ